MTVILDAPTTHRPDSGSVLVAHAELALQRVLLVGPAQCTESLSKALDPRRYRATARFESPAYLADGVAACQPDAVVIALGDRVDTLLEGAAAVADQVPTVIWSSSDERPLIERALAAGAAAYVAGDSEGLRLNAVLKIARVRFEQQRELRADLARTRQALADRKVIDRAKGILMDRRKLGEDQAYHLMRRMAMNSGKRLAEIARAVVEAPASVQAL